MFQNKPVEKSFKNEGDIGVGWSSKKEARSGIVSYASERQRYMDGIMYFCVALLSNHSFVPFLLELILISPYLPSFWRHDISTCFQYFYCIWICRAGQCTFAKSNRSVSWDALMHENICFTCFVWSVFSKHKVWRGSYQSHIPKHNPSTIIVWTAQFPFDQLDCDCCTHLDGFFMSLGKPIRLVVATGSLY